jgi:hypothetical protein
MLARPVGPSFSSAEEAEKKAQTLAKRAVKNAKKVLETPKDAYNHLMQLGNNLVSVATNTEAEHNRFFWTTREYDGFSEFAHSQTDRCIDTFRSSPISV